MSFRIMRTTSQHSKLLVEILSYEREEGDDWEKEVRGEGVDDPCESCGNTIRWVGSVR